jgi:hypothetical protein
MEITKWLKPPVGVSQIGESASVRAVTRESAQHGSLKYSLRGPS